jgi:hypothetical protein
MKYTTIDKLPTDRAYLHFEAARISDQSVQVDYELVLPLGKVDCRGTFDHKGRKTRPKSHRTIWLDALNNRRIPLGRTMIGTGNKSYPFYDHPSSAGEIDLPFRDGAHCFWDNEKLGGLPVIYSRGDDHWMLATPPSTKPAASTPTDSSQTS